MLWDSNVLDKIVNTRLSSIEAISKTLINYLINLMGLRDASASKNNCFFDEKSVYLARQNVFFVCL